MACQTRDSVSALCPTGRRSIEPHSGSMLPTRARAWHRCASSRAPASSEVVITAYVALLRAVNVGGRNRVAMRDLLGVLDGLGLEGGRSLLQSGNLVFRGDGRSPGELERLLEEETARRLSLKTDYLVRSAAELRAVIDDNPFAGEAERDPGHLLVMFLKQPPAAAAVKALQAAIHGPEQIRAADSHIYVVYPDGIGRSELTGTVIESRLGTRGTARNWNTILKLAALAREQAGAV